MSKKYTQYPRTREGRINSAIAHFLNGDTNERSFDNCFEMNDGELVVVGIMKVAAVESTLDQRIRESGEEMYQKWQAIYEKHIQGAGQQLFLF